MKVTRPALETYDELQYVDINVSDIDFPKGGEAYMVALESVVLKNEVVDQTAETNVDLLPNIDQQGSVFFGSYAFYVETINLCKAPRTTGGSVSEITVHKCQGPMMEYDANIKPNPTVGEPNFLLTTVAVHAGITGMDAINPILASDSGYLNFGYRLINRPYTHDFDMLGDIRSEAAVHQSMEITFLLYPNPYYQQQF